MTERLLNGRDAWTGLSASIRFAPGWPARVLHAAYLQLDLLLTLVLMVLAWFQIMPRASAGPYINHPLSAFAYDSGNLNIFDSSWGLDMAFKAHRGILLGRDVVYQYGPLYQWLWSLPSRVQGFSLGSFYATNDLFHLWTVLPLTYATAALLFRDYATWKRAFYILLIAAFWQPQAVRTSLLFFLMACLVYQMKRVSEQQGRTPFVRAAITSGLVVSTFLFSADSGVYACAMFAIVATINMFFLWKDKARIWCLTQFLCLAAGFAVLWVLLVNSFLAGPFDFRLWQASFDLASNYRWIMPVGITLVVYHRFFAYIAFAACTFVFAWLRRRHDSTAILENPASLLSIFFTSLLVLQSGMVRPDWGHAMMGLFPLIALSFAILMGDSTQRPYRLSGDLPVLLVLILTGIFCGPSWYFQPRVLGAVFRPYVPRSCPADRLEFDHACVTRDDYQYLAPVAAYLTQHTNEKDRILVFPHESIYGDVSRRVVSGGVLHLNEVMSPYLLQAEIKGLEADKPPIAIYSVDKLASWQIDGVPNLTRVPQIWLYLQRHYQQEGEILPGIFSLRSSEERQQRWNMRETALTVDSSVKKIKLHKSLRIGTSLQCPPDMDFLRLRITVRYPLWWRLLKPSQAFIEIQREDASYSIFPVLVRPNVSHEVWIYPWDDSQLEYYFAPNPETWRKGDRPAITAIRVRFEPWDFMSVAPLEMSVQGFSAITLSLN